MQTRHTSPRTSSRRARVSTSKTKAAVASGEGTKAQIAMTINRSPEELYTFWRNFENLPKVLEHVESIQILDDTRSRWRVRQTEDKFLEWEAVIINDKRNEMISWRTVEGSDVAHAGSIWFNPAPGDLGTEVRLQVDYDLGSLKEGLAKLLRRSPEQQMHEDLRHFKQWMEAGELPTTKGQPAGRSGDKADKYKEAK
jgi:uncharacterized membrane protein